MTESQRQVIAMGGGGFSMEPENLLLDRYIVKQARKTRPSVCFLPHATDDAVRYTFKFFKAFTQLDIKPNHLSLFTPETADLESFLMEQDIIYVGGGNTKSMLALWREWNLHIFLRQACENGTVLAGISAGANCWFEQCSTDSIPGQFTMLPGLGIIRGSFCPHYDGEVERRPSLHQLLKEDKIINGYAADDGAAVHFINGELNCAIASRPNALVANHAYSTMGTLEELTAAEIDTHLQVNVRGTLLLVQAFAAQHQGRPSGRVILLTSGQHLHPMPGELAYIASKGALHQLTLSLSAHLIHRGITVNTVNPGATDTGYADAELYESVRAANPQGRWGQPEDAARLIGWLATDEAQWITGQAIDSTGGGV